MGVPQAPSMPPEIERAKQLFRFLKEFAQIRVPVKRTLADQLWTQRLNDLPDHPAVHVGEVRLGNANDSATTEDAPDGEPLMRVARPMRTSAPPPPDILLDFLEEGWRDPDKGIEVREARNVNRDGETITVRFDDDPRRVAALHEWSGRWEAWAIEERPARAAMRVFEHLYELRGRIELDSERVELVLGDGRLKWRQPEGTVDHPVMLQRVELIFDPDVPEFRIVDSDRGPELYGAVLLGGQALTPAKLNELRAELEQIGYHPLAKESSGFLRRLVPLLSPRGAFHEDPVENGPGADPVLIRDPVLFLRSRPSGFPAAFDRVLQDLDRRAELSDSLIQLVGIQTPPGVDPPITESSPWAEPPEILLSKPANQEQIQIARALEKHRAVLVQGPPGTGKSHTIANLIGHLVAHGKRVLVTSHTTKALRVLRGHIVETVRPLCVAVLENDLEGRQQMEQSVRDILSRLTLASEDELAAEMVRLEERRDGLNGEIERLTSEIRAAREAEYLPITVGGQPHDPAEAARWVHEHLDGSDWIPGPVETGAPLPLSPDDVRWLYESNQALTREEAEELERGIPEVSSLPSAEAFASIVSALSATDDADLDAYWLRSATEQETPALRGLRELVVAAVRDLDRLQPWQRAIVAAGYAAGADRTLWIALARMVDDCAGQQQRAQKMLMEHQVGLPESLPVPEVKDTANEIGQHIAGGRRLGWLALVTRPRWKRFIRQARVDGRPPSTLAHFRAISAYAGLVESRQRVAERWKRQAEPAGLPPFADMPDPPEPALQGYTQQFEGLLDWWIKRWGEVKAPADAAGLQWDKYRADQVARSSPAAPFDRDTAILSGPLQSLVSSRCALAERAEAERRLTDVAQLLEPHRGPVCRAVRDAVCAVDPGGYERALDALHDLAAMGPVLARRTELLERLRSAAPRWADAIKRREGVHSAPVLPGDVTTAWEWRQLHQEIERRAALDDEALTKRLEQRRRSLRECTTELIDRRAWLGQLRRTDLPARQALQGWADTQRKIGKGTGKRAPALQAQARRLLIEAREAVPVWIMPLSRVAESFDATQTRFDVVIVDEASQSDVTGLLAWYLGDRIVVVGDHEQVSPSAVGLQLAPVQALISEHLQNIPNSHLYDGTTSIYDLARQCFGGVIALREHFRCVPDIIEFSNELSYDFQIRPLRNPYAVPKPHVEEFLVDGQIGAERHGKTNTAEAHVVVALLGAMVQLPEYEGKTFGAITLLGDEQAAHIQDIAVSTLGAIELEKRHFVAGNSAQFQGDERDVMLLSMVDVSVGAPLALRQTPTFKQRYNVAASRAKDQFWLVHSLDPDRDLKSGDLRRRLIEYVRAPGARLRELQRAEARSESPLESAVIQRLVAAGFRVQPQVWVGRYRIDIVVSDGVSQVAVECDGDRYHGVDQIPADLARQAVLERAGWRFVRVRGTRFYRDPDGTTEWLTEELKRRDLRPVGPDAKEIIEDRTGAENRAEVGRLAWEFMREQGWLPEVEDSPGSRDPRDGPGVTGGQ